MLDRSSFSCRATFFHFNSAALSVSSTSKDSWEIHAVPPSADGSVRPAHQGSLERLSDTS